MTDCEKYLALSMVAGKSKVHTFKGLQEKNYKTSDGLEVEVSLKSKTRNTY